MITFPVNLSQVTIIPRLTINNYFQVCFAEQLVLTKKMSSPVINLLLCIQQKELTITLSVNTFDLLSLTFFICKIIIFYSGLGPPDSSVIKIIDKTIEYMHKTMCGLWIRQRYFYTKEQRQLARHKSINGWNSTSHNNQWLESAVNCLCYTSDLE